MSAVLLTLAAVIGTVAGNSRPAGANELALFSYALPPVTRQEGAVVTGPLAEVVAELARAVDISGPPILLPVARLLDEVAAGGGLGFPLARNPVREPRFTWIVKLYSDAFAFATLAPHPPVDSFEAARQLGAITINNSSAPYNLLIAQGGFTNLDVANSETNNALRLFAGHTDAWFSVRSTFAPTAAGLGLDASRLVLGAPVHAIGSWLIGPRDMDPARVEIIRARFAAMQNSDAYQRLLGVLK